MNDKLSLMANDSSASAQMRHINAICVSKNSAPKYNCKPISYIYGKFLDYIIKIVFWFFEIIKIYRCLHFNVIFIAIFYLIKNRTTIKPLYISRHMALTFSCFFSRSSCASFLTENINESKTKSNYMCEY